MPRLVEDLLNNSLIRILISAALSRIRLGSKDERHIFTTIYFPLNGQFYFKYQTKQNVLKDCKVFILLLMTNPVTGLSYFSYVCILLSKED